MKDETTAYIVITDQIVAKIVDGMNQTNEFNGSSELSTYQKHVLYSVIFRIVRKNGFDYYKEENE